MTDWTPTPYERTVLREARDSFRNPYRTPLSAITYALARRGETPEVDPESLSMIGAAASAGLATLTAAAAASLREKAVWRAYRREGVDVRELADVERLELWQVDEVAESLRTKYACIAVAAGACSILGGAAGLALDAPIALGVALRAALECAAHYGFDPRSEEEQAFAMQIVIASIVPGVAPHEADLDVLASALGAMTRAWKRRTRRFWAMPLVVHVLRRLMRRDAKVHTVRRLAGFAAAAANAWLVIGVIETAQAAYRGRFLARARAGALAEPSAPFVASAE